MRVFVGLFSFVLAMAMVASTASAIELRKMQKLPGSMESPISTPKPHCIIYDDVSYSPATGLELLTYVTLSLKYKCEGAGTAGPVDIEVLDGAGKLRAATRNVMLEGGEHVLSMPIWQWQDYAYSNSVVVIIKYGGVEVYKRVDAPQCSQWWISKSPGVLLNKPIE